MDTHGVSLWGLHDGMTSSDAQILDVKYQVSYPPKKTTTMWAPGSYK